LKIRYNYLNLNAILRQCFLIWEKFYKCASSSIENKVRIFIVKWNGLVQDLLHTSAVARSENPEGHVVLWWAQSASLVEIGFTVLPKTGAGEHVPPCLPPGPPACDMQPCTQIQIQWSEFFLILEANKTKRETEYFTCQKLQFPICKRQNYLVLKL
jgi:hypothetical protein